MRPRFRNKTIAFIYKAIPVLGYSFAFVSLLVICYGLVLLQP